MNGEARKVASKNRLANKQHEAQRTNLERLNEHIQINLIMVRKHQHHETSILTKQTIYTLRTHIKISTPSFVLVNVKALEQRKFIVIFFITISLDVNNLRERIYLSHIHSQF